jgi:hypothetical protein
MVTTFILTDDQPHGDYVASLPLDPQYFYGVWPGDHLEEIVDPIACDKMDSDVGVIAAWLLEQGYTPKQEPV